MKPAFSALLCASFLLAVAGCGAPKRPDGGSGMLATGAMVRSIVAKIPPEKEREDQSQNRSTRPTPAEAALLIATASSAIKNQHEEKHDSVR